MAEVHILNVGQGDCNIIHSGSGRVTMFDICGGNIQKEEEKSLLELMESTRLKTAAKGNFKMCQKPNNPIEFLKSNFFPQTGASSIFRFILSHPDMDHLDGFNNLINSISVLHYWDNVIRKDKPDFKTSQYKEEDWDRYIKVRDGNEIGIKVVSPLAGDFGQLWNKNEDGNFGGDYIYIYAPDSTLVKDANENGDVNDASYVIVYRSGGGRILFLGDAHNKTMEYVLKHYSELLVECEFMLAPHHGRDSDRDWKFLDVIKPKFTVFGCAPSRDLAYSAWNNRGLEKITQNQAGNVAIYPDSSGLYIYVENERFVEASGGNTGTKDKYGNTFYKFVSKSSKY